MERRSFLALLPVVAISAESIPTRVAWEIDGPFPRGYQQKNTSPLWVGDFLSPTCFKDNPNGSTKVWWVPSYDPERPTEYSIGVHVAETKGAYSYAFVNLIGKDGEPDQHAAVYSSNTVDLVGLAVACDILGRAYNNALLAVACHPLLEDSWKTNLILRERFHYPNLYRWKYPNSKGGLEDGFGFWTANSSRNSTVVQHARKLLSEGQWKLQSALHVNELKSGMISIYAAHECS